MTESYMDIDGAVAYLKEAGMPLSRAWLYKANRTGEGPPYLINAVTRKAEYRRDDLAAFVAGRKHGLPRGKIASTASRRALKKLDPVGVLALLGMAR